jgi:hypothetical protein
MQNDDSGQARTAFTQPWMEEALVSALATVDLVLNLEALGSVEAIASRMLSSLPDVVISEPRIGACYTTKALADWKQVSRQAIVAQRQRGRIIGLLHAGHRVYPAVQFDHYGKMRPAFEALLEGVDRIQMSPADFSDWLHRPQPETGQTPSEQLAQNSNSLSSRGQIPRRSNLTIIQPPAHEERPRDDALTQLVAKAKATTIEESLTTHEVSKLLKISFPVVRRRRLNKLLYAFRDQNQWRFPTWQFHDRTVLPGLTAVLESISPHLHPVLVQGAMLAERPSLTGDASMVRPRDWLRDGGDPARVIELFRNLQAE